MEWAVSILSVAVTALLGVLAYVNTKKKIKADRAGVIVDNAVKLNNDYREAYEDLKEELAELREEIEGLRGEIQLLIREGEMWRSVAAAAISEYMESHVGAVPKWWPHSEPVPEEAF